MLAITPSPSTTSTIIELKPRNTKLTESLTKTDRNEIRSMIRREIDVAYRDELKKKIVKEITKILKGKENQDVIVDVTKKVLKKFHRELYFDYTPVLSRLKI